MLVQKNEGDSFVDCFLVAFPERNQFSFVAFRDRTTAGKNMRLSHLEAVIFLLHLLGAPCKFEEHKQRSLAVTNKLVFRKAQVTSFKSTQKHLNISLIDSGKVPYVKNERLLVISPNEHAEPALSLRESANGTASQLGSFSSFNFKLHSTKRNKFLSKRILNSGQLGADRSFTESDFPDPPSNASRLKVTSKHLERWVSRLCSFHQTNTSLSSHHKREKPGTLLSSFPCLFFKRLYQRAVHPNSSSLNLRTDDDKRVSKTSGIHIESSSPSGLPEGKIRKRRSVSRYDFSSAFLNSRKHGVDKQKISGFYSDSGGTVIRITPDGRIRGVGKEEIDVYCVIEPRTILSNEYGGQVTKMVGNRSGLFIAMSKNYRLYATKDPSDPNTNFKHHYNANTADRYRSIPHRSFVAFKRNGKPVNGKMVEAYDGRTKMLWVNLKTYKPDIENLLKSPSPHVPTKIARRQRRKKKKKCKHERKCRNRAKETTPSSPTTTTTTAATTSASVASLPSTLADPRYTDDVFLTPTPSHSKATDKRRSCRKNSKSLKKCKPFKSKKCRKRRRRNRKCKKRPRDRKRKPRKQKKKKKKKRPRRSLQHALLNSRTHRMHSNIKRKSLINELIFLKPVKLS